MVWDVRRDVPAREVFGIFRVPTWMGVLSEHARWLRAFPSRSRQNLITAFPVITHGCSAWMAKSELRNGHHSWGQVSSSRPDPLEPATLATKISGH